MLSNEGNRFRVKKNLWELFGEAFQRNSEVVNLIGDHKKVSVVHSRTNLF